MDRRSFLTLIASAPLAALAPLPKVSRQQNWYQPSADQIRFINDLQHRYNAAHSAQMDMIIEARRDVQFVAGEQWPTFASGFYDVPLKQAY